jgi:O-antigen/teichoic acid export membrane protein
MAAAYVAGLPLDAVTAMILACASIWLPALGQLVVLNHRLLARIEPGPKSYDVRLWLATALPILMAEGFYLLLAHADVLLLQQFRPPEDVAVYYAAAKTLALVSFIHFAIAATTAHRFAAFHATGDHAGLASFLRQSIRWTFWPSLIACALLLAAGEPLLRLFGPDFAGGYHLMFILAIGLLARAAVGPMERLLNVLGHQRLCALACAAAFAANVVLCLLLIPRLGAAGAAVATAAALLIESAALFTIARLRLGLSLWGRRA